MPAFEAREGMPYWIDLLTSETRKSAYFYSRILGWDVEEGEYRIARLQSIDRKSVV